MDSVDESVPEHRDTSSSSYNITQEPRAKVVPSKHNIFTHFSEGPKLRHLLERPRVTRASCRRRDRCSRAHDRTFFGDSVTADHKDLSEECRFPTQSSIRYVVVQDLATQ